MANPGAAAIETTSVERKWRDVVTLQLEGELGEKELVSLLGELDRLQASGCVRVVLDFTEVTHLNYRGVRPLMARARAYRNLGGDLKLSGMSRYLHAIFRCAGAYGVFEHFEHAEQARASFSALSSALSLLQEG